MDERALKAEIAAAPSNQMRLTVLAVVAMTLTSIGSMAGKLTAFSH